ncbi:hypothetical protein T05_13010 [Trichinella murrelli]|uniref:Uncharacterized protein n=1 Tax=Trichinella murrelli TaxID=144512 RepID=A0A0V0TVL2_9BILA|nr:hypothetical protein T05_13010 [Trichinella murrelli]
MKKNLLFYTNAELYQQQRKLELYLNNFAAVVKICVSQNKEKKSGKKNSIITSASTSRPSDNMLRRFPTIIIKPSLFMTVCLMTTFDKHKLQWRRLVKAGFWFSILQSDSSSSSSVFYFLIIVAVGHWNCKYLS